ncbi:efflux RND transporter permease subunit [Alkaliphilus serpentinus]|uniref:Efflux RND transporter permease subunit n=1 Tax=Alkaliphilus serpentinus TaxID=1482731 RepID=A0A833HR65_9FIRM|nr:efflux RND transporter permease subunit [Alkaliphilus serpentinus]KAB3533088.1 efflux RND transporter permease subunit [Alkaliphilus serpentinus]
MKLIEWAVEKSVSVIMVMLLIIILGTVSLFKLSMDLLPKIDVPIAVVNVQYPSAGPHEIENIITRPIESAMAMVHNVKTISSSSSEGNSNVIVEFNQDTDMDFATLEMREKIDLIRNYLPGDISVPMVMKIDPNALPIMQIGVSGNQNLVELYRMAEDYIKPRLERLTGVAAVDITGGSEEVIEVIVDPIKLTNLGISLQQLVGILRAENINLPVGDITDGDSTRLIRTIGELESLEDIKKLPIPSPTGVVVPLQDIAEVTRRIDKKTEIAKMNGLESIQVTIQKQPVANTVKVADIIHNELDKLRKENADLQIEAIIDQSLYIKNSIGNVGKTAMYGGILAVILLYIFLRDSKSTLIIALAIPISIMATFTLMFFFNITLNLLSLGGFALGVGMLVDNGIVVTENIHRYREKYNDNKKFAIMGADEVAMAVIASTFTTLAVFLPIAFVEGMTAQIFRELALTVTFALLASLGISLTLVPMLSSRLMKKQQDKKRGTLSAFNDYFDKLRDYYRRVLEWSLNNRVTALAIAVVTFLVSMSSLLMVGAEYFPQFDEGTFTIDIRLPQEANLEDTEEITKKIEETLEGYKEIDSTFVNIGGSSTFSITSHRRVYRATIDGRLVSKENRKLSTAEVVENIRQDLKNIPGATIKLESSSSLMSMGFGGASVEVEVKGEDLEVLKEITDDIIKITEGVEGTREVVSNYVEGRPQMALRVNREVASRYGLQSAQVAATINQLVRGVNATQLKEEGKEIQVIVRGADYLINSQANFLNIPIMTPLGITVPLQQVADLEIVKGPSTIRRRDQVRTMDVSAVVIERDVNTVTNEIKRKLDAYPFPNGYSYTFRGQREQLVEAVLSLILVGILAILLVYMILASQFQSYMYPFIIMLSVPLAFSGGALGLFITRRPISVPALIGAVVLAGIVVNNGIVLIDYINVLRKEGVGREESLIEAGDTRLRPIMMTTLTTVLGLIPLAIGLGEGGEAQAPMATVVIGGLLLSTLLTLIIIPVIYVMIDDLQMKLFKKNMQ